MAGGVWRRGATVALVIALSHALSMNGAASVAPSLTRPDGSASPNQIVVENGRPGTRAWAIGAPPYRLASQLRPEVAGYASATSVSAGEVIRFAVSVTEPQPTTIAIYRLGWYGGAGGRRVAPPVTLPSVPEAPCPPDRVTGMIACHWPAWWSIRVPADWVSGLYLATLTTRSGYQNAIPFVVRDDASAASIVYVQPVTTYQAYNAWPTDGRTGKSLYGTQSFGADTVGGTRGAVAVSFDRPYSREVLSVMLHDDLPFLRWMERYGYDVTYATSVDLDREGMSLLRGHRVFLSVRHDEYWTLAMRAAVTEARDAGISLAFFGANNLYWQARFAADAQGNPDRVLVCYRSAVHDPERDPALVTVRWRDAPLSAPEQALLGAQYASIIARPRPWVVADAGSWVFAGTGLHAGSSIGGLVAGEGDRVDTALPVPAHRSFTILASSPFETLRGMPATAQSIIYQAPSGAWVFDAGTYAWPQFLGSVGEADPRVARITATILDRMAYGGG